MMQKTYFCKKLNYSTMKKQLALIVVVLLATFSSFGQIVSKNNHFASAFIGLGGNAYDVLYYNLLVPPVGVQYEVIVTDKVGIGHVGVSGIASYAARTYGSLLYNSLYHYFTVGARGAYHFDLTEFFDDPIFSKLDPYAGLMLGMNFRMETSPDDFYTTAPNRVIPIADLIVGGRYFFSDNLAVMAELGFNVTFLNVGVTMKLNK